MDAHRLLAWAADRHGHRRAWDLLEGIYNAYHCHGLYVGSSPEGHVNLLAAAERAGLPRAEAAAVLAEPGVYAERVQSDMAAHKGVKAIPRVEIAGRLRLSGCKTVEQYVTAIRAALRDMEDEQAPAAGSPRCARQREDAAGTALLPQLHSAPCSPWPSAGALRPQPQPRSGSPVPQAQLPSQPKPQAQQSQPPPHPPQQPPSPQARPLAATGSPPRCQAQAQAPGPGAGSGSGPGPKRASPSLTLAATRSPAANPLQQLLQAHAAAAATTSRFQRSSSGPHMLHHRTLTGGGGGGGVGVGDGGTAGGGRPQQASGLRTTRRQFGSGLHADCSAHAGTEVLQVRVTAAPGVESGCPSASAPVTWMDSVEPMSPTEGLPSAGASASIDGTGAGSDGRGGGRTPGAFAKSSDGGVTGGGCPAAASPRTRMARVSSDRDGPSSAGAASYSSPVRGAYGVMDVAVEDVSSPVGSPAEQQQQPRRYRRPPAKGKSLLQLVRSDLAAGAGAGGGGGGGVLVGGDRSERVESAVQVLQLLHSNLLGGGGASSGSSGGGGGRDVSPSSRSLLAGRLGVGGSSNRVRVGATDREGALIATALQRKTFRERVVASSDGTTDVFPQPGMLGSPGEDGGVGGGGVGRLGRAAAMAVRAAGGGGGGGDGDGDRSAAVTSPGGPTAGGSGPTLKHGATGRSLLGVGSTSSHHHLHHHYQHPHQHSPQRVQYDRSASLGLGGGVSPSGGSGVSPSGGGAGSDSGSTGAGAGGLANSAPGPPTRFSCNGGAALIPSMVGGAAAAVATVGSGGQVVGGAGTNRSLSPGNQVLHVSPSGRLPATQEAGGRAADAVGAAPPHFASGPLTLAAAPPAPPAGGATSTGAAAAAGAMPPPVRLVLDTAASAGGRGAAAGSSDGRDSQGVPLAHTGGLNTVALSPGGGASSRLVSASRSPSGAPPSPSVLSLTPRLALSEVAAVTSLLSGSPRAGGTAGAAGSGATPTPSPPHSHASNKVAPAPVTISVSARLPEVAAPPSGPAPQLLLSSSSAPAVAQPPSPQALQPQPPSQPQALQPPQPAGSKPAGRVVTLTGTRAVGAGSVPSVAGPSSPGTGSGWAGAPGPAAGAAANGESRTTSGNSSIGDGASSAGGSRRKLKSFLPPLLARLFG
ncbi:hypothetical protein CHLRE_12g553650v5 [Chlamydomonas reinhardtii]|nr:uncharacterized protein CHLRE_12g553650v5 [Chlamydomonas reinhardtii]PNW75949.1 hypothetical protein CHLRE_12g553650v5 [Chlamydomonas reinhardtii]